MIVPCICPAITAGSSSLSRITGFSGYTKFVSLYGQISRILSLKCSFEAILFSFGKLATGFQPRFYSCSAHLAVSTTLASSLKTKL